MKARILCGLLLLTMAGCKSCREQAEELPVTAVRKYCYVLCDFSGSQDPSSRNVIVENAKNIFGKARQYNVRYYNIASQPLEPAFFQHAPQATDEIERPSDRRKREEDDATLADSLAAHLARLRQASSGGTCIISAIDKVCRSMAREVSKTDVVKVIILSDMQEDCAYSFGKIDIDHAPFSNALKALGKMPKPFYTFAGYENLELTIVGASQQPLDIAGLEDFWAKVFVCYDLKSPPLIAADLPEWVKGTH